MAQQLNGHEKTNGHAKTPRKCYAGSIKGANGNQYASEGDQREVRSNQDVS